MSKKLHLFAGYGVELEYMVVAAETLAARPIVDELFFSLTGNYGGDINRGKMEWSNELTAHVVEFKNRKPMSDLKEIARRLQEQVETCNKLLQKFNARLLPTGAHPFMKPLSEAKIWPHGHNEVYQAYNRIFDCRGHGWSNVQSAHLNLPFYNDDEFGRLHAAIRLLLPIIPSLSASTPILEGRRTKFLDTRLECYRKNQARVPSLTGSVVPEAVFTKSDY